MKAALPFLVILWSALVCPTGHATTTDDPTSRQEAKPPIRQLGHSATVDKHIHDSRPLPKPATPRRAMHGRKGSLAQRTMNSSGEVSGYRSNPTNAGPGASRDTAKARSARSSTVSRPAASLPNVRHHSANPPTIGGPKSTTAASTAALSGRAVSRRP